MLNDILPGMVHCHMPTIQKFWDIKHDLKLEDAKFIGYWEDGGYSGNGLKISRYDLKSCLSYQHLLIVGNIGRKEAAFPAKYNPAFLRKCTVKNLWNNQVVTDLKSIKIAPGNFLLLGISAEK